MKKKIIIGLIIIISLIVLISGLIVFKYRNDKNINNENESEEQLSQTIETDDSNKKNEDGIVNQAMFKEDFYDINDVAYLKYNVYEQMSDEVKKEKILSENVYDLDKDGTDEKISFVETKDKLMLKINNQIIDRLKKCEHIVYIIDFDKTDDSVQILVKPNGWYDAKVDSSKIYNIKTNGKNVKSQKAEILNREYYYINQENGKIIPFIDSNSSNGSTIFDHLSPIFTSEYYEYKTGTIKKYEYDIKNLVQNEFTANYFWYTNDYKNIEKLNRGMSVEGADIEDLCNKNHLSFLETDYVFSIKSVKKLGNKIVLETISGDDGTTQYIFDFGF